MNLSAQASAPGKVVLSGEYAVLDGAPSICMAVNRRARATLTGIEGATSRVTAPGFSNVVGLFRPMQTGIEWREGGQVFGIIDAVRQTVDRWPDSALDITLDTSAFIDPESGLKIGIGSSAAVTTALCAAVAGPVDIREIAHTAHRNLQQGSGSGVDIACSLTGGLICYGIKEATVTGLSWPDGLRFRLIWTGVAASTTGKLARLRSGSLQPSRNGLAEAAELMASSWVRGDVDQILNDCVVYVEQLREFGLDHRLGIFDAGHEQLLAAARAAHLVYKPCGAGGGDIGILLGRDESALETFVSSLPANFSVIDCALDLDGVLLQEITAR